MKICRLMWIIYCTVTIHTKTFQIKSPFQIMSQPSQIWMQYFSQCESMRKILLSVCLSQRESRQISDPLLFIPIQKFLIMYNLRRYSVTVLVDGCFAILFENQRERTQVSYGFLCLIFTHLNNKKIQHNKGGNHQCDFEISAGVV